MQTAELKKRFLSFVYAVLKVHKRYVRMAVVNKKVILTGEGGR